ncbi:MAG TPA: hypothetical protein DEQ02_08500 [Ruminococcaceae bacterium]|nr:hypothetical protein [Oscillospiraceae bacterium]
MNKLLLHACCAPCAIKCIESLKAEPVSPALFWFGPNIHPFTEYESRKNALITFAESSGTELIIKDEYGLRNFIKGIFPAIDDRCDYCYRIRMEHTARYAAENGFDSFSTTLLISPYQQHEKIREIGEECAEKYHLAFLYRDFRPLFREGQRAARELGLYMQKYCGCIFSEEERYRGKGRNSK